MEKSNADGGNGEEKAIVLGEKKIALKGWKKKNYANSKFSK